MSKHSPHTATEDGAKAIKASHSVRIDGTSNITSRSQRITDRDSVTWDVRNVASGNTISIESTHPSIRFSGSINGSGIITLTINLPGNLASGRHTYYAYYDVKLNGVVISYPVLTENPCLVIDTLGGPGPLGGDGDDGEDDEQEEQD